VKSGGTCLYAHKGGAPAGINERCLFMSDSSHANETTPLTDTQVTKEPGQNAAVPTLVLTPEQRIPNDEAAPAQAGATEAENAFDADGSLFDDDDVDIIDEDALRDLVAEMVKRELEGPMGERITRNVRKMVRREIAQALAAKEVSGPEPD